MNNIINEYNINNFDFITDLKKLQKGITFDFLKNQGDDVVLKKGFKIEEIDFPYIYLSKKKDNVKIIFPTNAKNIKGFFLEKPKNKRKRNDNFQIFLDGVFHKSFQDVYIRNTYLNTKKFKKLSEGKLIELIKK